MMKPTQKSKSYMNKERDFKMVKYKVSFEITDEAIGRMSYVNKEKWIEMQKQFIEDAVYDMELEYQGIYLKKVTNLRIEGVEEND